MDYRLVLLFFGLILAQMAMAADQRKPGKAAVETYSAVEADSEAPVGAEPEQVESAPIEELSAAPSEAEEDTPPPPPPPYKPAAAPKAPAKTKGAVPAPAPGLEARVQRLEKAVETLKVVDKKPALPATSTSKTAQFDSVPLEQRDSIVNRLRLVEKIIRTSGRAYDYRSMTNRELQDILSQLETPAAQGGQAGEAALEQ